MKADTLPTVGVLASAARRRKWSVLDGMVTAPTANLLFVSVLAVHDIHRVGAPGLNHI